MKAQITRKQVKANYYYIIRIPYCDAQSLLSGQSPNFYTCGVYGWNADIYDIDGVAICTGYRTFGNVQNRELTKKYEQKARKLKDAFSWKNDTENFKKRVNKLLKKYIDEVIRDYEAK